MRYLIVADLHYNLKQYDWILGQLDHFDCLIIAGDLLDLAGKLSREIQSIAVMQYLAKYSEKAKVIVCSGNHDGNVKNKHGEWTARWLEKSRFDGVTVDGDCISFHDVMISVIPWWDGDHTREKASAQVQQDAQNRNKTWIWVYHAPPKNSPVSWSGKADWGDEYARQWIELHQPDIVFSGHVHQSPFVKNGDWHDKLGKTYVFNTGREPSYIPSHIIYDTEIGETHWISSAGRESISVDL